MGEHSEAADVVRRSKRGTHGETQQRPRVAPAMMILVDRQLAQQGRRHGIRLVALKRLRERGPLDLPGGVT